MGIGWHISLHCNGSDPTHFMQPSSLIPIQDTEFPGVVARPIGTFKTSSDYHYQTMRCNVDLLKIIQLGITLANDEGQLPQECSTWQFNFKFNLAWVTLKCRSLLHSCTLGMTCILRTPLNNFKRRGLTFNAMKKLGFCQTTLPSLWLLLVLCCRLIQDGYHFIGAHLAIFLLEWLMVNTGLFHSGYDFGYFVKLLTAESLPRTEEGFFDLLKIWFPTVYDIKYLMKASKVLKGGLQEVADDLGVSWYFILL